MVELDRVQIFFTMIKFLIAAGAVALVVAWIRNRVLYGKFEEPVTSKESEPSKRRRHEVDLDYVIEFPEE